MSSLPRVAPTRRTVLRAAAWTAPAVSIAVAAPAYASASTPFECKPTGCKAPGAGAGTKDFFVSPGCNESLVASVYIDDKLATHEGNQWVLRAQKDSGTWRTVTITSQAGEKWTGPVQFGPC